MGVLTHLADEAPGWFRGDFRAFLFSAERTILRSGEIGVQLLLILFRCVLEWVLVPWRIRRIQPAYARAWPASALQQADVPNVGRTKNQLCSTVGPPSAARRRVLTRLLEIGHPLTD